MQSHTVQYIAGGEIASVADSLAMTKRMHVGTLIHQKPYETQVFSLRRHWLLLAKHVVVWAFVAALPIGGFFFLQRFAPDILAHPLAYPTLVLGASAFELAMWLVLLTTFLDYELDLWVVTNDRLIAMEQHGLFARTVSELDLWRVQDVTTDVRGVLPTMMDYGDVHVQTAGAIERFVLEDVPDPNAVRQIILDMADIDRKFHTKDVAMTTKVAG